MREPEKYCGVIPAFYACYDDAGEVSPERVRALAEHLIRKGVKGVYVGGSSGECIYQSVDDRKRTLENVMAVAKGRITVIAHVAPCREPGSRRHRSHSAHLLSLAGIRHRRLLERDEQRRTQHRLCDL